MYQSQHTAKLVAQYFMSFSNLGQTTNVIPKTLT